MQHKARFDVWRDVYSGFSLILPLLQRLFPPHIKPDLTTFLSTYQYDMYIVVGGLSLLITIVITGCIDDDFPILN